MPQRSLRRTRRNLHVSLSDSRDGRPRVPGDLEDHERDDEADDRVADSGAEGDHDGAGDDAEGDEAVDPSVVSVRDERRAVEPAAAAEPHLGGDLVADEADRSGRSENPEMAERLR